MMARSSAVDDELTDEERRRSMSAKDEFNRQVRLTAVLTVGLLAALIFGIIGWPAEIGSPPRSSSPPA